MARIQLRDTNIFVQDGLSGTAEVEVGNSALAATPVTVTTQGVNPGVDEVQRIVQFGRAPSGGTYTLYFEDEDGNSFKTGNIAYNAAASVIEAAIDSAAVAYPAWADEDITVAEVAGTAGLSDGGGVTVTFDGGSVDEKNWNTIIVDGALLTGTVVSSGTVLGVGVTVLNTDDTDKIPVGARFTIATEVGTPVHTVTARYNDENDKTLMVQVTPAIASAVADTDGITFLPQQIEVKIGEGDLTWTETKEYIYDLDRDRLDTVRAGQEQPVELEMQFIFDYVTTESGQRITPVDALKRIGEASEWVSSSDDACEPYAVDLYVIHCVPCGTEQDQDFLFPDFRYESLEYSVSDASISVSGRCNTTDVITTRDDFPTCS